MGQIDYLAKKLPDYDWVGAGRDDGKNQGEFSAIFYLNTRFDEWERTGKVESAELATILPNREQIAAGVKTLEKKVSEYDWGVELGLLRNALNLESETGSFYKRMVAELDTEGQHLFQRFLEIEDAHYDLVQAQLDALQGNGFWYDYQEFSLEKG